MKRIENQLVRQSCDLRISAGHHVDTRLLKEIEKGSTFSLTLEDEETFLSLVWQEIDDTRILTPLGRPRTLHDVAKRLIDGHFSFESLASDHGFPKQQHQPAWFEKCVPIEQNFSYERFGFVSIVPATDSERRQSPNGSFYIYDGVHKTLVLAVLLILQKIKYEPTDAILLLPRR